MVMAFLFMPGRVLSAAELSAARLDGDVVDVGDGYIPTDAAETRELRAASLRPLLGDTLAATHVAAAWVHGALATAPSRLSVRRAVPWRLTHVIHHRLEYRDAPVPEGDLLRTAGVHVTTPARTLVDLLRVGTDVGAAAARQMVDAGVVTPQQGLAWLGAAGAVPNKRPATHVLRVWLRAGHADVTR